MLDGAADIFYLDFIVAEETNEEAHSGQTETKYILHHPEN